MRFRFLSGKEDAEILARWAASNPDIPVEDARSLKNHQTTEAIAIEEDGEILLILPFYAVMQVAFFGFNPEADGRKRIKAMNFALQVVEKFCSDYRINAIQGFSNPKYKIAEWSVKHGFELEDRQAFIKTLPRKQVEN
jgi:hypothetical protein